MKRSLALVLGFGILSSAFAGDRSRKSYEGFLGKSVVVNTGQNYSGKVFQDIRNTDVKRSKRSEIRKSLEKLGLDGGLSEVVEGIIDDFDSFGWEQTKLGFRKNRLEVKYTPKNFWGKGVEFGVYGSNQSRYGSSNYSMGIMIKIPF